MAETPIGAKQRAGIGQATTATHPERTVLRGAWRFTLVKDATHDHGAVHPVWWLVVDLDLGQVIARYRRKRDADHHVDMLETGTHEGAPECDKCTPVGYPWEQGSA